RRRSLARTLCPCPYYLRDRLENSARTTHLHAVGSKCRQTCVLTRHTVLRGGAVRRASSKLALGTKSLISEGNLAGPGSPFSCPLDPPGKVPCAHRRVPARDRALLLSPLAGSSS